MNKLETAIYEALLEQAGIKDCVDGNPVTAHNCKVNAIASANVAMQFIRTALDDVQGYYTDTEYITGIDKAQWIKENIE